MHHHQALAIVFLLVAIVASSVVTNKDSVYQYVSANGTSVKNGTSRTKDILKCVSDSDFACVLDKVEAVLIEKRRRLLEEADKNALATISTTSGRKEDPDSKPSVLMDAIGSLVSEISEMLFKGGLSGFFRDAKDDDTADLEDDEEEDEEEDDDEEADEDDDEGETEVQETKTTSPAERSGREVEQKDDDVAVARKKKNKKKFRSALKLILLGAVLFFKITLLLKLLAAHMQFKFLAIAAISLLINAARFWLEIKKGHSAHPQKVIYYEHAQHNHHYENEDDWSTGSGGPGGYWNRKTDKDEEGKTPHDLAYAEQKPQVQYAKMEDQPSFSSWF